MPGRRKKIAPSRRGLIVRGPLALAVLAFTIACVAFGVPAGLWRQPGFAELRGGVMQALGLPTPQPALPAPSVAPGSWYQVYFTNPRYPDREGERHGGIDGHLVQLIAEAQRSVDVAAYELNLETVADALLQARDRGVAVRLVTDSDNLGEETVGRLQQGGVVVVPDERGAIMHDKFVVVDGRRVWTGSWNLTVNCTYRNNNNVIVVDSDALARNYQAEFAEMFDQSMFGPRSPSNTPLPQVTVEGTLIESYFAPEDQVAERIAAVARRAQESVRFMAFSFTDEDLAGILVERAGAGVALSGVVEKRGSESQYAQYAALRQAGIDVLLDGNPYVMHHKVLIVDDAIVVTGSFNFTQSADEDNDENVLIIHSRDIARQYLEEFQRVRRQAAEAGQS